MKVQSLHLGTLLAALAISTPGFAEQGAPHTLKAAANYSSVSLSWQSPETVKELKWHNDYDYDGSSGISATTQKPCVIYIASEFSADELTLVQGEQIEGLSYFEYRPTLSVTALLYEDGKLVREAAFDLKTPEYKADQWRSAKFAEPYTIVAGKDLRIALRIEHGSNIDYAAIMDKDYDSRADLYSYDGKTWMHNGHGSYLVTANLANSADEAPNGYNVYVDGVKVNDELLTSTEYTAENQADGKHTYKVEAVYANASYFTPEAVLSVTSYTSYAPSPSYATAETDGVNGTISWGAPLVRNGNSLTWSNLEKSTSIGGTASKNTKVWIKNEFEASDLIDYVGSKISAINAHFAQATVTSLTLFVIKDDVIIYSEEVSEDKIAEIDVDKWVNFPLAETVEIEAGHTYAYGYLALHTASTKPISIDTGVNYDNKGSKFSVSNASSTFNNSSPYWKTLASGNIPGNWMMTADVTGGNTNTHSVLSYNVTRDGEVLSSGVTDTQLTDVVPAPGTYTYGISAVCSDGKVSSPVEVSATYALPEEYRAPLIDNTSFDDTTGVVSFDWNMDVEIKHYSSITYIAGFDEEMTMSYGTVFTADELSEYAGMQINKLQFIIGDDITGTLKVGVFDKSGNMVSGATFDATEIQPVALYTVSLDSPVAITGEEDLYIAYNATLPAGNSPIVLDAGPLVDGGAMVNLGAGWMKLGTINSTYNNYNIVIGAIASEASTSAAAAPRQEVLGNTAQITNIKQVGTLSPVSELGVSTGKTAAPAKVKSNDVASYNVYCNGELLCNTTEKSYEGVISEHDTYSYTVTAVYANGWESNESDAYVVNHLVAQKSPAPYDLDGNATSLTWKAPESAPVMTLSNNETTSYGVGMTGSGTRTSYIVHKYTTDMLTNYVGQYISHIKFALYSTDLYTASIVIFKDFNIVYEQEIEVSSLKAIGSEGYNDIRLNVPYLIEGDGDLMIGYHLTYANGVKPMIYDGAEVNEGGNLLSASATATSWKTLTSMNSSLVGNWRIYATLMKANSSYQTQSTDVNTYTVYLNGEKFREDLTTESYNHGENLPLGTYTVTATINGEETAESNEFVLSSLGVDDIVTEAVDANARYYDLRGVSVENPAVGNVYIRVAGDKAQKVLIQ